MPFSHDGLRDSLTQLAAPPYFYESLRREIAISARKSSKISLIRFLIHEGPESRDDLTLLSAHHLSQLFRFEDLVTRIGENEFIILIAGDEKVVLDLCQRLSEKFRREWIALDLHTVSSCYSNATYLPPESAVEFLNRLDQEELIPILL